MEGGEGGVVFGVEGVEVGAQGEEEGLGGEEGGGLGAGEGEGGVGGHFGVGCLGWFGVEAGEVDVWGGGCFSDGDLLDWGWDSAKGFERAIL